MIGRNSSFFSKKLVDKKRVILSVHQGLNMSILIDTDGDDPVVSHERSPRRYERVGQANFNQCRALTAYLLANSLLSSGYYQLRKRLVKV